MKKITNDEKYKRMFQLLGRWVSLNECGLTIGKYLKEKKVRNIAIYGFGILGKHLLFELREAGINIVYGIDKRNDKLNLNITFIDLSDKKALPDVDFLIVTAVSDYEEIEKEICEVRKYPVISLEELINDLEKYRRRING